MGRIEAQADLRDDLSPKIAQTAQNVDSAVGKMKGDFADLERSTTASFGEMVGAFATGTFGANLFQEAIRAGVNYVQEAQRAHYDHNKELREAGFAYDTIIDKQDQYNRKIQEGQESFGLYVSRWAQLVGYMATGGNVAVAAQVAIGDANLAKLIQQSTSSDRVAPFKPRNRYEEGLPGAYSSFDLDAFGVNEAKEQLAKEAKADAKALADARKQYQEDQREIAAADRERIKQRQQEVRENNQALRVGISSRLRGFSRNGSFSGDAFDPSDPYGSNKSSFSSPSDGSRDGEFGAFNPISDQYMKALKASQDKAVDDAKKWGNLWSGTINSTLEAVLFDTHNFGKDFANIIKKALMQALVGDISASAGGPIGKILGGILGIKDARTGFETQVAPEMARASARGKL